MVSDIRIAATAALQKVGQSRPLFAFIFGLFKQTLQFLQQIYDSNPQPSEHESLPITTRPAHCDCNSYFHFKSVPLSYQNLSVSLLRHVHIQRLALKVSLFTF